MSEDKGATAKEAHAPKVKHCGACGESFECSTSEAHCWCEELKLTGSMLSTLRAEYTDCLCPKCLAAAATRQNTEARGF